VPYLYKIHAMANGSRSSSDPDTRQNLTSALVRWAMPSMTDLIFIAVVGVLVVTSLSVKLLNDAGIGWHVRTGQQILATHAIPRVDPFSSQIQKPWIAWEWMYDVIVGELESSAGLNGVVWFTAVVIAGTFAAVFRLLLRRGTNLLIALVLTLLAIASSMIHFLARPHVLSWLFVVIWFWILDSVELGQGKRNRSLWLLPILMLIWVNVHGGFLLGFVLLSIYSMGSFWTWLRTKEFRIEETLQKIAAGKRLRQLTLVGISSIVASLANPYGWKLHSHIYEYLGNRFFMDHIDEFQSPNFHGISPRCFLAILLIAVAVLTASGRKLRLSHVLVTLFAVYSGLYASRNVPIASILLVLVIAPPVPSFGLGEFSGRMNALESTLKGHIWPMLSTIACLVVALNGGHVGAEQLMNAHFDPQRMPVAAVDFLDHSGIRTPLLSPDYWGGYLIYRLYHNRVVIDDRHDFYGERFLSSYLTTMHAEPGWEDFLKSHPGCLVLPRKAAVTALVTTSSEWKTVYSDDVAVVFVSKRTPRR
jgi:hypothetical protein